MLFWYYKIAVGHLSGVTDSSLSWSNTWTAWKEWVGRYLTECHNPTFECLLLNYITFCHFLFNGKFFWQSLMTSFWTSVTLLNLRLYQLNLKEVTTYQHRESRIRTINYNKIKICWIYGDYKPGNIENCSNMCSSNIVLYMG